MGSAFEVEYWLLLARDLTILNSVDYRRLSDQIIQVKKMLTSMIRKIASSG